MFTPSTGGWRAWSVFGAAALIYVMAVAARTSFAVAVPEAGERFAGGSGVLAVFVVLQLAVYALAQVPVGIALDRFGARRVLVCGGVVVAGGQALLACADSVPTAVLARVMVGGGDATAFIGTLRLLPAWFSLGRLPLLSQVVSLSGQLGQVISAIPFLALLHATGWTSAFAVMSGCTLGAAVAGLGVIADAPAGAASGAVARGRVVRESSRRTLAVVLRQPGTWQGYFSHWLCMFPGGVFTLMWGPAWMTQGLGVSPATASGVLTLNTVAAAVGSLAAGAVSGRWPARRGVVVLVAGVLTVGGWVAGLSLGAPVVAAATASLVLGASAPFSGIGFDVARSYNEPSRWGTCTGVVNTGGFTATIVSVELIGLVLDAVGGDRSADDFVVALAAAGVVWCLGLLGYVLTWRTTARMEAAGRVHARF